MAEQQHQAPRLVLGLMSVAAVDCLVRCAWRSQFNMNQACLLWLLRSTCAVTKLCASFMSRLSYLLIAQQRVWYIPEC
jgi:hypothetical protein